MHNAECRAIALPQGLIMVILRHMCNLNVAASPQIIGMVLR